MSAQQSEQVTTEPVLVRSTANGTATVFDLLDRAATVFGDRVAIVDGDRRLSYSEIRDGALAVAHALPTVGVKPGDRVAIWMPNCLEWVLAFFGAVRAGAVVVPLNTGLAGPEAEYQISQSGAVAVFAATNYRSRNLAAEAALIAEKSSPDLKIITVGAEPPEGSVSFDQLAASGVTELGYTSAPDDPFVMLYTSGTTGSPKGAVHTHRFLESLLSVSDRMELTADDCVVLYLPLFHVYALVAGLILLTSAGAKVVLMSQFDAAKSLALMEAEKGTIVYGIPTTYIDQLNDPGIYGYDHSTIRLSITPFSLDLCQRVSARFGYCANTFGMTETASIVFLPEATDPPEIAMATVGRPLEGVQVRIVDPDTRSTVRAGETGLLHLRGPQIMSHYHDKPDETEQAFEDGWFNTGDLARLDPAGNLIFIGRGGDHFKVGGEYVDPVEVETALQSHPWVERAAVVGIPDERLGFAPHAWVILAPTAPRDLHHAYAATALKEHARARISFFKVPRAIHLVADLPVTPSGKVQKFKLSDNLSSAGSGQ